MENNTLLCTNCVYAKLTKDGKNAYCKKQEKGVSKISSCSDYTPFQEKEYKKLPVSKYPNLVLFTFNGCGLLAVVFALHSLCFADSSSKGTVYFLNVPETIKTAGVVRTQMIRGGEISRIFWHYKNATGATQKFSLVISGDVSALHSGQYVSSMPGIAGTEAMYSFLNNKPASGQLALNIDVPNGKVVSGIAEGIWTVDSALTASMGSGMEVSGIKNATNPHLTVDSFCTVSRIGKTIKLRLCGDKPGHLAGDYGSMQRITIESKIDKKIILKVAFSPRGGEASCIYEINGRVVKTKLIGENARYPYSICLCLKVIKSLLVFGRSAASIIQWNFVLAHQSPNDFHLII
jgi:hypothetical protein